MLLRVVLLRINVHSECYVAVVDYFQQRKEVLPGVRNDIRKGYPGSVSVREIVPSFISTERCGGNGMGAAMHVRISSFQEELRQWICLQPFLMRSIPQGEPREMLELLQSESGGPRC